MTFFTDGPFERGRNRQLPTRWPRGLSSAKVLCGLQAVRLLYVRGLRTARGARGELRMEKKWHGEVEERAIFIRTSLSHNDNYVN